MAATRGDGKNVMAGIYNMKLRHWSCDFFDTLHLNGD